MIRTMGLLCIMAIVLGMVLGTTLQVPWLMALPFAKLFPWLFFGGLVLVIFGGRFDPDRRGGGGSR